MRRSARALAGLVTGVLLLGLAGCGSDEARPFGGQVLENPYPVPATALTDTSGASFSLAADTDKRLTLVFFGYVNCVDVCPAVLTNLASAMTRLDEADRDDVEVVMVSTDPDTDTAESIRAYLDQFDESFIGLRSDWDTTNEVARQLAVGLDRRDPGGHTTQVLGIDSADESPVYWSKDTSPSQYADDIHTLLEDS